MRKPSVNLATLLQNLGRASTPQVKQSGFGLSLLKLLRGSASPSEEGAILFVGSRQLYNRLTDAGFPVTWAVPGAAADQAEGDLIESMVIENSAFDQGPWLYADAGSRRYLAEELFEAGRKLRARGAIVFYLPEHERPAGVDEAYIMSTSTVNLALVPIEDLEEEAPQSHLWNILTDHVSKRRKK